MAEEEKTTLEQYVDIYDEFLRAKENEEKLIKDPHNPKYYHTALQHVPLGEDPTVGGTVQVPEEQIRELNKKWKDEAKTKALEHGAMHLDEILDSFEDDELFSLVTRIKPNPDYPEASELHKKFMYYAKVVGKFSNGDENERRDAVNEMNSKRGKNLETAIRAVLEYNNNRLESDDPRYLSQRSLNTWTKALASIALRSPEYAASLYNKAGSIMAEKLKEQLGGKNGIRSYVTDEVKDLNSKYDQAISMYKTEKDPDRRDYYDKYADRINDAREDFYQSLYQLSKAKQQEMLEAQIPKQYRRKAA